jgi:hypothetical protein
LVLLAVTVGEIVRVAEGDRVGENEPVTDVVALVDEPMLGVSEDEYVALGVPDRDGVTVLEPVREDEDVRDEERDGVGDGEGDSVSDAVSEAVEGGVGVSLKDEPELGVSELEGVSLGVRVKVDDDDKLEVRDADDVRLTVREGVKDIEVVRVEVTVFEGVALGVCVDDSDEPELGVSEFDAVSHGVGVKVDDVDKLEVLEADDVRLTVRDGVGDLEAVRVVEAVDVNEELRVAEDDSDDPGLGVIEFDGVSLIGDREGVPVKVEDCVPLGVRDAVNDLLRLRVGVTDVETVREVDTVNVGEELRVGVGDGGEEEDGDSDAVPDCVGENEPDWLLVPDGVYESVGKRVLEAEKVGDLVREEPELGVSDGDRVLVSDDVPLLDRDDERVPDMVRDVVIDGEIVELGVRVDDSEAPALGVSVFDGVGPGVVV